MEFPDLSPDDKLLALYNQLREIHLKIHDALARLAQIETKIEAVQKAGPQ